MIFSGIVELHGGSVRATSEGEGFGCTFIMELPLFQKGPDGSLSVERPTLNSFGIECIPENEEEQASLHASARVGAVVGSGRSDGSGAHALSPMSPPQERSSGRENRVSGTPERDLEAGQGLTSPMTSPSKHVPSSSEPAAGVMSWLFRAGGNVKNGAQQFLNQNVTIVNARSGKNYFTKQDTHNTSSKDLYHINQDYDSSAENSAVIVGANLSRGGSHERIFANEHAFPGTVSIKKSGSISIKTSSQNNSSRVVPFEETPSNTAKTVVPGATSAFTVAVPPPIFISPRAEGGNCDQSVDTHLATLPVGGTKKSWTAQLRFLAVDDAALNRKMMGRILCGAGHVVEEAGDGTECLQMMNCPYRDFKTVPHTPKTPHTPQTPNIYKSDSNSSHTTAYNTAASTSLHTPQPCALNLSYDAILMDENMPSMSGPEAASWLRKAGYAGIIIGVTGDCYEDQMEHFVSMGADVVLPKPLKLDKLRSTLETLWQSGR